MPTHYSTPEYRDADYAAIAPADVIGQVTVTDAQISRSMTRSKATYVIAGKARHSADRIQDPGRSRRGARQDHRPARASKSWPARRGLKPAQISLGTLTEADLPDADRAKAIFALPLNEVSQPVKSGFGGYVLMRVTKITPGSTKTLADVKEDIRKTLAPSWPPTS